MTVMTLEPPRQFPWPALLSVGLHGAVVAGLLYASVNQTVQMPAPSPQAISVTMVAPEALEPPQAAPAPQPLAEPEPEPEPEPVAEPPKEAPVVIHKPKPKPKPRPKPVKKVEQPKQEVKRDEPRPASPFDNNTATRTTASAPRTTPGTAAPSAAAPSSPRALSRNQPQYPPRAYSLRMEGQVRVKFDVSGDGRVENVSILSAKPANMFEREVKQAMRKWRYEAGKPGKGLVVNIVFRINGGATLD